MRPSLFLVEPFRPLFVSDLGFWLERLGIGSVGFVFGLALLFSMVTFLLVWQVNGRVRQRPLCCDGECSL